MFSRFDRGTRPSEICLETSQATNKRLYLVLVVTMGRLIRVVILYFSAGRNLFTSKSWSKIQGLSCSVKSRKLRYFSLDPSAADWRRRRQPESSGAAAAEKRTARRRASRSYLPPPPPKFLRRAVVIVGSVVKLM